MLLVQALPVGFAHNPSFSREAPEHKTRQQQQRPAAAHNARTLRANIGIYPLTERYDSHQARTGTDEVTGSQSVQARLGNRPRPDLTSGCLAARASGFSIRDMFLGPFHRGLLTSSQGGLPVPGGGFPVPGCGVPVPGCGVAVGGRRPAIQPDLV